MNTTNSNNTNLSLFGHAGLNLDSKGFKQLLDTQSLVDCTLACDGGKISAHKIVLSACSSYLAKILIEHPVEHPIIILPELNIEDVKTLVHYMYTGELLKSDTLHSSSLLRTAAILSVNSLNDFLNGTANASDLATVAAAATNGINHGSNIDHHHNLATTNANATTTTTSSIGGLANIDVNTFTPVSANIPNNHRSNNIIVNSGNSTPSNGKVSDFQFKCPVCQSDFMTICSFEYHMQRIHNVTSFGCELCHKPFASLRYVLTDHMRRCHGFKAEQRLQSY